MSTTRYYQIGGFRPDIRWFEGDWDDKKLVALLAGPDSPLRPSENHPLELVLGIKCKGTSHILLADTQASAFERTGKRRPYKFTTATDYESVSPIYFNSAAELRKKLGTLKPKARKGKKEEPWDTSQANKSYTGGDQGILRGEFEHGRVLQCLLRKTINPAVYSISDVSWTQGIRFISFVCNLRAIDSRPYEERQQAPRPLDYGWAEADALDPRLSLKVGSAVHLIRAEDRLLGTGRPNLPFKYGTTQIENHERIMSLAQQFFNIFQSERADVPTILLVHNEKLARNALHELGVQTLTWRSGISDLLRQKIKTESSDTRESQGSHIRAPRRNLTNDVDPRRQRVRDRSRSPTRGVKPDPDGPARRPLPTRRSPSVPGRRIFAPVYIVDVQALYWTMMQSQTEKFLGGIAQNLGVLEDGNSWCAGNEAVYIFQIWLSMVSGVAIDERRASMMVSASRTVPEPNAARESSGPAPEDSDEEFDPNDIVQVSNTAQQTGNGDDDSETDYGSDY